MLILVDDVKFFYKRLQFTEILLVVVTSNILHYKLTFLLVSQPAFRREGDGKACGCVFHGREMRGVATNIYSRKTSKKPERVVYELYSERFGSCFYVRGRYQHPTHPSQGTTPFNQVCKYDFKIMYFSLFSCFFQLLMSLFVFFLSFCGRQGCFPRSYVFLE